MIPLCYARFTLAAEVRCIVLRVRNLPPPAPAELGLFRVANAAIATLSVSTLHSSPNRVVPVAAETGVAIYVRVRTGVAGCRWLRVHARKHMHINQP